MKGLPTIEEAAAFGSLLNEVAKNAAGSLAEQSALARLSALPSSCSLKKGQPETEQTRPSSGFSLLVLRKRERERQREGLVKDNI